jgi:hypothetical protein
MLLVLVGIGYLAALGGILCLIATPEKATGTTRSAAEPQKSTNRNLELVGDDEVDEAA